MDLNDPISKMPRRPQVLDPFIWPDHDGTTDFKPTWKSHVLMLAIAGASIYGAVKLGNGDRSPTSVVKTVVTAQPR